MHPLPIKALPFEFVAHGHRRIDKYFWMRNRNDPDFIKYIEAWNEYTKIAMRALKPLVETIKEEVRVISEVSSPGTFRRRGMFEYRTRRNNDRVVYFRINIHTHQEQLIIDESEYKHQYFSVLSINPSPSGRFIILVVDTDASHRGNIVIKDMVTEEFIHNEKIEKVGTVIWDSNSTFFWYVKLNNQVYIHFLGTNPEEDKLIFTECNPTFHLVLSKDKLNRYIVLTEFSKNSSCVWLGHLNYPDIPLRMMNEHQTNLSYKLILGGDKHFLLYSSKKANWGVAIIQDSELFNGKISNIVRPKVDREIVNIEPFREYVAMLKRVNGLLQILIIKLQDNSKHFIPLPEEICDIEFSGNIEFDSTILYFEYSSCLTPKVTYSFDMKSQDLKIIKRKVIKDFNPGDFVSRRIWAIAEDREHIPIIITHKKGLPLDGNAPLVLYGYGAYGHTEELFHTIAPALLKRGAYFAIAQVRGGGALGRRWYGMGTGQNKQTGINDFITCAEFLIKNKYTSPQKMVAYGSSAGGLLVGGAINMRPELFKACLADVPFVDVLNTMFDETLHQNRLEWEEWGNPANSADYRNILGYSPYENIRPQHYPALFVHAALQDAQVHVHEQAKWTARLVDNNKGPNPIYLKVNMKVGHMGPQDTEHIYKEAAQKVAFILSQML